MIPLMMQEDYQVPVELIVNLDESAAKLLSIPTRGRAQKGSENVRPHTVPQTDIMYRADLIIF